MPSGPSFPAKPARLVRFAWLALIALLVQVNAPVRSTLMALPDPTAAALCAIHVSHDAGLRGDVERKAPPIQADRCRDCPVCHLAGAGPLPTPDPLPTAAVAHLPTSRPDTRSTPVRAPPVFHTRARGPPIAA